jgi:hypothetical protein
LVALNGGMPVTLLSPHADLSANSRLYDLTAKGGDVDRRMGTMVLSAGPAAPVVHIAFVLVLDAAQPGGHCTFVGTATPAG